MVFTQGSAEPSQHLWKCHATDEPMTADELPTKAGIEALDKLRFRDCCAT